MRYTKVLAKTFLSFAASGAGSAFGIGVVVIGLSVVSSKIVTNAFKKIDFDDVPEEETK